MGLEDLKWAASSPWPSNAIELVNERENGLLSPTLSSSPDRIGTGIGKGEDNDIWRSATHFLSHPRHEMELKSYCQFTTRESDCGDEGDSTHDRKPLVAGGGPGRWFADG